MRVGTLAYATEQGLGYLARSFVDVGIVTDVVVVDHPSHATHNDWYHDAEHVPCRALLTNLPAVKKLLDRIDVFLAFETPFDWGIFRRCREMGKKSYLLCMHECSPVTFPCQPDVLLCPSLLDLQEFSGLVSAPPFYRIDEYKRPTCYFTPVPISADVQWRQRYRAEVFIHNAGWGSFRDRNGTQALLDAWKYVKSPANLILRSQKPIDPKMIVNLRGVDHGFGVIERTGGRIDLRIGTLPRERMCGADSEGDVFIFPERFNGLSLPLQEARAAGMLVMAGNRFPMNTWLPRDPLIPTSGTIRARIGPPYREFDEAQYDPKMIAEKIDEVYRTDISEYSRQGREWAESMSWYALKPKYLEVLSS